MTGELPPGATAPPFRLPLLHDSGVVEGPPRGELTLLIFVKESCPTCRWAMPHFRALHERLAGEGLSALAVAQGDPDAERAFFREMDVPFPVATERSPWSTSAAYGLTTVPTWFLIEPDGTVALTSPGFARDELLEVARRVSGREGSFPEGEDLPAFRPG